VTRAIYDADGDLIRSETWNTSYKGETRIVLVGTKQAKKPEKKPGEKPGAEPGAETPPPAGEPTTPPAPQP
jgi:hypothetical protein